MRVLPLLIVLLCAANASAQEAELVEDASFLRVTVAGRTARLESLIVKRKDATGKLPIALIAHGKPASQGRMLDDRAIEYTRQAHDLARRGYLAVVTMRRGFGGSDGPAPVAVTCTTTSLVGRFDAEADDLQATLDAVAARDDADGRRMIAIGVSAGGAAVVALAARNPPGLVGVVNVSGGLRFQACPKEDELVSAFKEYGAKSRVPQLWIYAKNDSFFPEPLVGRMQAAFLDGGGDVKLVNFDADERFDGHHIFRNTPGRAKWLPQMDAFLRFHKLPTWTRNDATTLLRKLGAKETMRGFAENYLAGPTERVLAKQKSGTYIWSTYGSRTIEDARKAAIEQCEKRGQPCEVVMVNDRWIGPEQ